MLCLALVKIGEWFGYARLCSGFSFAPLDAVCLNVSIFIYYS